MSIGPRTVGRVNNTLKAQILASKGMTEDWDMEDPQEARSILHSEQGSADEMEDQLKG